MFLFFSNQLDDIFCMILTRLISSTGIIKPIVANITKVTPTIIIHVFLFPNLLNLRFCSPLVTLSSISPDCGFLLNDDRERSWADSPASTPIVQVVIFFVSFCYSAPVYFVLLFQHALSPQFVSMIVWYCIVRCLYEWRRIIFWPTMCCSTTNILLLLLSIIRCSYCNCMQVDRREIECVVYILSTDHVGHFFWITHSDRCLYLCLPT